MRPLGKQVDTIERSTIERAELFRGRFNGATLER
jgi:hypothetical protein